MNLRVDRSALGISQSRLARLSGVSRFKICTFELGSGALTNDELDRIRTALRAEADRLRSISRQIDVGLARGAEGSYRPTPRANHEEVE
jgi:predicted transcriptional regulator